MNILEKESDFRESIMRLSVFPDTYYIFWPEPCGVSSAYLDQKI